MTGVITVMKKYASTEYMNIWKTEFSATRTAQYSLSPFASMFQTRTIAMHLARPTRMSPFLKDVDSARAREEQATHRANMMTGPIAQLSTARCSASSSPPEPP